MHNFFKDFLIYHSFCNSLTNFRLSVHTDRGRGAVKQKGNKRGQGREGLNTSKNVRTYFIDEPKYSPTTGSEARVQHKLHSIEAKSWIAFSNLMSI